MSNVQSLLSVRSLSKSFDGVRAADGLSFELQPGVITALIGPNGSGKTTVFNLLTGVILPDSGRIVFKNRDITRSPAHAVAAMGLARTFQNIRLFPQITGRSKAHRDPR